MPAAKPRQRILLLRVALLDRGAVEHAALPPFHLVEDDVADRVAVAQHDARVVRRPGCDERAVRAPPQRLCGTGRQVNAHRGDRGLLARLDREVRDALRVVDVQEVGATSAEHLRGKRLGEPAVDGNRVREVVLVPVRVDHHDDPPEPGRDAEEVASDELRVLQCDLRRQERLGHAARSVHRVEAQVTREIRDEGDAVLIQLRLDEEAR